MERLLEVDALRSAAEFASEFAADFAESWLANEQQALLFKVAAAWLLLSLVLINVAWWFYGKFGSDYLRLGQVTLGLWLFTSESGGAAYPCLPTSMEGSRQGNLSKSAKRPACTTFEVERRLQVKEGRRKDKSLEEKNGFSSPDSSEGEGVLKPCDQQRRMSSQPLLDIDERAW
ncbi:unnamed protein product [Lampetra planeri]